MIGMQVVDISDLDNSNKYRFGARKKASLVASHLLLVAGMLLDVCRAPAVLLRWMAIGP